MSNKHRIGIHYISIKRSGVTLLELMAYGAVLILLMTTSYLIFAKAQESSATLKTNSQDIISALNAGEQWRNDIRLAIKISQQNNSLVLTLSDKKITYRFQNNIIEKKVDSEKWQTILTKVYNSTMSTSIRNKVVAWCWEVELNSSPNAQVKPLFTFYAVGGNK